MAMHAPAPAPWRLARLPERARRPVEGRAERIASWLIVYLTAFLSSLALGGAAWALGLIR